MAKFNKPSTVYIDALNSVLETLSYREREVLKLRYGISDGYVYTPQEVARIFKTTTAKINKTEAIAIRKLQHPVRARKILEAIQQLENEEANKRNIETRNVLEQVEEVTPELIQYLKRHHEDIEKLPWQIVEQVVAECLASRGFDSVRLVGRNSNTAADIFAIEKSESSGARIRYFIEVKRRKTKVGVEVIDRVFGAMHIERASWGWHLGMIVSLVGFTNFHKYSRKELELMGIELRDRNDVVKWLNEYRPTDKGLWLPSNFKLEKGSSILLP